MTTPTPENQLLAPSNPLLRPDAESLKRKPRVIREVIWFVQNGVTIYCFVLTADELIALALVEPFDPKKGTGVNRALREEHATDIALAMTSERDLIWVEPFFGNLQGLWIHDKEKRTLSVDADDILSTDEGQHRLVALRLMNAADRQDMRFLVTAARNLPFERRVKIFGMQDRRLGLDKRLIMAHMERTNTWGNDLDQRAYQFVRALNEDDDSVIKGKVIIDEPADGVATRKKGGGDLLDGKGLVRTVRKLLGRGCPFLCEREPEAQLAIIKDLLLAASEVWPVSWKSSKHVLFSGRGINAILRLMHQSPNFIGAAGMDASPGSLRLVLGDARNFNWLANQRAHVTVPGLTKAVGDAIGRGHAKRAVAGSKPAED